MNRIRGLWPLLSSRMELFRMDSGELIYRYNLSDGTHKNFAKDMILRISGFSHSGLLGYQPVKKNTEAIGLALALQEYFARFFGNGAVPPAALEHPGKLSQEAQDRLKKNWNTLYQGLSNSQRIGILEEGMTLKTFGVSPEDAQAIDARKFQIDEVCRVFNMPPHMLKSLDKATYSNIEEQGLEFVIYTLRPWLVRFEQTYSTQLLNEKERKRYFFEHNVSGLLRGDIEKRYAAYVQAISNGLMNADEVRELENMNPQADGQGEKYYVPLNWIPKEDAGIQLEQMKEPPPAKEPEETVEELKSFWTTKTEKRSVIERDRIIKQYMPLFKQAAQRIVNREAIAVKKEVKKYAEKRANPALKKWLEDFYSRQSEYIKEQIGPVFRSFAEAIQSASAREIGVDDGMTDELFNFVTEYIDRYAERHTESSRGQLLSLLEEEVESLEVRVDEWRETRPDKIATNETVRESNAVFQFVAFSAGLKTVWRIRGAATCPYCRELSGRAVATGQSFVVDGQELNPKGADAPMKIRGIKTHPPLHRGCDCYLSV
jgi:HK97 family phage portal protein